MSTKPRPMPLARTEGLVVQDIEKEVLVFDLDRNKAHCLNPTAALVWQSCDGETPVAQVERTVCPDLPPQAAEQIVTLALQQLHQVGLLQEPTAAPGVGDAGLVSRRALLRTGMAIAVLPVVATIVAPTAAHAQSCSGLGGPCGGDKQPCCPGLACADGAICKSL